MHISNIYKQNKDLNKTTVSFEIFPPKKDDYLETILETLDPLCALSPAYISVTYGASGSENTNKTAHIAKIIKTNYGVEPLAHLTSIASSKQQISALVDELSKNDIKNILALRGDVPEKGNNHKSDFRFAKELIRFVKSKSDFCLGAACYAEGHIDCYDDFENIDHLKQKQDEGASFFVSQLFFDNNYFLKFFEQSKKAGITVPISAGVMPILSKNQVQKMIFMCGVSLPAAVIKLLNKYEFDSDSLSKAGIEYACKQAFELAKNGVDGVHIYTMNRPEIAKANVETLKEFM